MRVAELAQDIDEAKVELSLAEETYQHLLQTLPPLGMRSEADKEMLEAAEDEMRAATRSLNALKSNLHWNQV